MIASEELLMPIGSDVPQQGSSLIPTLSMWTLEGGVLPLKVVVCSYTNLR